MNPTFAANDAVEKVPAVLEQLSARDTVQRLREQAHALPAAEFVRAADLLRTADELERAAQEGEGR